MTYDELRDALHTLGLRGACTVGQVKSRHRDLVKRYHPDSGSAQQDPEAIRNVNAAYRILQEYVEGYRFSFSEDEFYEQNPEERIRMQFMETAMWGKK